MSKTFNPAAITTTASSVAFIPEQNVKAFSIGFAVIASATINYDVEFTYDNTTWHNHATVAAATATATGTINFPVAGVRLTVNSVTGGSAELFLIQD